jgi:hypothetical protein
MVRYAAESFLVKQPELSEWECKLFGGEEITWRPRKGGEPNWFWRLMQYLIFGNRWAKTPINPERGGR